MPSRGQPEGEGRGMKRLIRMTVPVSLTLLLLFVGGGGSGCAYLNTFYLTKKNFGEAERLRKNGAEPNNTELKKFYTAAIENGALILQNYKTSAYVDNSLFIMGMSYFHLRDFPRARTKYDELITTFPQSEFSEQAKYYRARCYLELSQTEQARIDFRELALSGSRSMRSQAGLALVEMTYRNGDWNELAAAAGALVDSHPEETVLNDAVFYLGEALYRLEKYPDALPVFQKLDGKKLAPDARFRVNTRLALCLAHDGRYDEALAVLETMQRRGEFAAFAPGIRLEMGSIYELKGDTEGALQAYTTMAADFPDSIAAREAWYRVGTITLRDITKAGAARDAFAKVTPNMRIAEMWFTDAESKVAQIDTMKARSERIEKLADKPDERAHERFLLAEILTWSLDHRTEAGEQYRRILEEAPESEFAVRSHFLLGLAERGKMDGPSASVEDSIMRETIARYPESRFAQGLKMRLGDMDVSPDVRVLREADLSRLRGEGPDVRLRLYQAVIDSFPGTRSAYQARFAQAWCLEHEKGGRKAADSLYRALAQEQENEYNRDFVRLAAEKIKILDEEEKIIAESRKNIAYYESEIEHNGVTSPEGEIPSLSATGNDYSGFRKIRARNERIRSRY